MRSKEKRKCSGTCGRTINPKSLYKKEGKEYCSFCIRKFRKIIRLGFMSPNKPPKHIIEGQKDYHKRKVPKGRLSKEKPIIPKIPGVKKARSFKRSPYQHLYLTRTEKEVLYKKYVLNGLTPEQARKRLSDGVKYLGDLVLKMKNKGVKEKEINRKFKEEFAKLVEGSK